MKTVSAILLTLFIGAAAKADGEVIRTEKIEQTIAMSTMDLRCELRPGFDPKKPDVSTLSKTFYLHGKDGLVLLEHETVYQAGCNMKGLSKLVKQASMYYGFIYGVKATVTREYSINKNACVLEENIALDLGEGVILKDMNRDVVKTGCS